MRRRATFILWTSVCAVALAVAGTVLLSARHREGSPRGPISRKRYVYTAPAVERVDPGVAFVDVTGAAGIDFVHVTGAFGEKYLPETMGSGVGIFDYDGPLASESMIDVLEDAG
ncbi:MAG: hypothetical protein ACE5JG_11030, partial [Planctomycetota bacterium]